MRCRSLIELRFLKRSEPTMKIGAKIAIICVGFVFLGCYGLTGCVSQDIGYHCDFTGSTKSWTRWFFTIRTNYQYNTSPLESFLTANAPERIQHKWVSYQGTGRNIFGKTVFLGHGTPNALCGFPRDYLRLYIENSSSESVLDLYETLRRADRGEIKQRVDRLFEESEHLLRNLAERDDGR